MNKKNKEEHIKKRIIKNPYSNSNSKFIKKSSMNENSVLTPENMTYEKINQLLNQQFDEQNKEIINYNTMDSLNNKKNPS